MINCYERVTPPLETGAAMEMIKPRIKPEHLPFRVDAGLIRIGGMVGGIAGEIEDPAGSVWSLLEFMDGTRDTEQLVSAVLAEHPGEAEGDVRDAIAAMTDSGYVEDADSQDPAELSDREKERYCRSRSYFRWVDLVPRASTWEPQLALRQARVTVAGLGGAGGFAAMTLAASGVGNLHCVDGDAVEWSNLNRQVLFDEGEVGLAKVDAGVRRLRRLNSDISVTAERVRLREDDLELLAKECDVLLMTADNPPELRLWTNRACLAVGRPWVDVGYHGPLVSVGTYVPWVSACWECVRAGELDIVGHSAEDAVIAVSAGMSGILAAHAVIRLLTGVPPAAPGQVQAINLVQLNSPFVLSSERRPDCPGCGSWSGS
jgi:molybdopterin/thiamine biosynthesis adenylyltransferase